MIEAANASNDTCLSYPPSINTVGLVIDSIALMVESGFVPFESFNQRTSLIRSTNSIRCSTPAKDLSACAKQLVDAANDAGGGDNITVILVDCTPDETKETI